MQEISVIDASMLRRMFLNGTKYLDNRKDYVNELNVFPVPDGDTGTNMTLTLMSAARELADPDEPLTIRDFCRRVSSGTLRGARGNSGVIMSQLCRGFAKIIENARIISLDLMADAFDNAVESAYKAVLKPVEGTMLTVARESAHKARELSGQGISIRDFLQGILEYARATLSRTPEMLPVLKEAGVVDSGGQGLVEFMTGAYHAVTGEVPDFSEKKILTAPVKPSGKDLSNISTADIKFIYCTEFIVELKEPDALKTENELRNYLSTIGDSIVCVGMDDLVKVHVHTNHPGQVIERALLFGELSSLKIDNMRIEHNERLITQQDKEKEQEKEQSEPRDYGFVCVCPGDGIAEIYKDLGVDVVIDGGQTMNPSTDDFLNAIRQINAKFIYLFPNNSNIIMAADQAKKLAQDKDVYVIPSANICQGISAMISFDPELKENENTHAMLKAVHQVNYAEVTYAVRSTTVNGTKINKGDYMGICSNSYLAVSTDPEDAALKAVNSLADTDPQLITVYYGDGVSEERVEKLREALECTDADIETVYGGQKVYDYIISVE